MNKDTRDVQADRPAEKREAVSYRERLEQKPLLGEENAKEGDPEVVQPDVEALRALVEEADHERATFQSVAMAAVQILERALSYEREAAQAALSLGQQEKLDGMVETLEKAAGVLRTALNAEGASVMHLCAQDDPSPTGTVDNQPWWFALTDALEVLEEGTGQMTSLTTAQPDGSPARALSQLISHLLRGHHDALLLEAGEWIS